MTKGAKLLIERINKYGKVVLIGDIKGWTFWVTEELGQYVKETVCWSIGPYTTKEQAIIEADRAGVKFIGR